MTAPTTGSVTMEASAAHAVRWWPPSPWETVAAATTLLAISIAVGPVTGVVPVAVLSLVWFLAVASVIVRVLITARRRWTAAHWVFVAGVGLAALRMSALGLVQLAAGRSALFWNVDWRYHATQAYGIARFGGVSDSLDYAGRPVEYHAGPSWIAGSLDRTLGLPVNFVLFVLVPLAGVLVVALSAHRLLRCLGAGPRAALLAVAVAMSLTAGPVSLAQDVLRGRLGDALLDPEAWWFTPSLMLNSLFALAVGFTAAGMIVGARSTVRVALGGLGLATVVVLKPQYFVGIAAVLGIGYLVTMWRLPERRGWSRVLAAAATVAVSALAFSSVSTQSASFTGISLTTLGVTVDEYVRSRAFLFTAVAAILVVVALPAGRRRQPPRLVVYAVGAVIGAVVLAAFVDSTAVLLDSAQVAHARAVGIDYVRSSFQPDVQQALVPVMLIVAMIALAMLVALFRGPSRASRLVPVVTACVLIALPAPFVVSALSAPTGRAAYEWTEESDLDALFARVAPDAGVWIASDLADSAQDFGRPLRATNLTSLGDAQFFVSNVAYGGWTQDDVVRRVRELRRFYETPWSQWHVDFLRRRGIEFVLVRDRCPAAWDPSDFPGRVVGTRGDWTLLEVGGPRSETATAGRRWPAFTGEPAGGTSECLSGRLVS